MELEFYYYKKAFDKALSYLKSDSYKDGASEEIVSELMEHLYNKKEGIIVLLCLIMKFLCQNYKLDSPYSNDYDKAQQRPYTSEELSQLMKELQPNQGSMRDYISTIERLATDMEAIARERGWC